MAGGDEDSLPVRGIAVDKIPVRAWMIVIAPKLANVNLFFPLNAYILKILGSQVILKTDPRALPEHQKYLRQQRGPYEENGLQASRMTATVDPCFRACQMLEGSVHTHSC